MHTLRKTLCDAARAVAMPAADAHDMTMLDALQTCRFFGGDQQPLHPTTLYRGISTGKYPKPVKLGPGTSRWVLGQCRAALREIIEQAGGEKAR